MKIISIVNGKGGVGKTTTAIALAMLRASQGRRVLLGDFDNQGNLTSSFRSLNELIGQPNIYNVFKGERIEPFKISENLDLLPATNDLLQLDKSVNTEELFYLGDNLRKFYSDYDEIILDTPGTLGTRVTMGLIAADGVVIPTIMDEYSFQALVQLFKAMQPVWRALNPNMILIGLIGNQVDGIATENGEPILRSERDAFYSLRDLLISLNLDNKILGLIGKREAIKKLRDGKGGIDIDLDPRSMLELGNVSQKITDILFK